MRRLAAALAIALAACSSSPKKGGYYKDDGPGGRAPSNLASIPDATPRSEPLHKYANRPYEVFGRKYVPLASVQPFHQRGVASWYGKRFHGQKTASGETYDMYAMSAAHPVLPIPSYARITSLRTGKQVVVRINDRGPFHSSRSIDLSYAAAYRLGLIGTGSGEVEIEAIVPR
jgi:rare lipoprotein A